MVKKKVSDLKCNINASSQNVDDALDALRTVRVSGVAEIIAFPFWASSEVLGDLAKQALAMAEEEAINRWREESLAVAYGVPVADLRLLLASPLAPSLRSLLDGEYTSEQLGILIKAAKDMLDAGGWEYHG